MRPLLLLFALLICAPAPASLVVAAAAGADDVPLLIEQHLTGDRSAAAGRKDRTSLALGQFYGSRSFLPMWSGDGVRDERAREVAAVLLAAEEEGLRPADYRAERIAALVGAGEPRTQAELELVMSRAFVAYARDVHAGRVDPTLVDDEHRIVPQEIAPATVLFAAGLSPDPAGLLRELAPKSPEYRRLRAVLAAYRGVAANGGWTRVPEGGTLRPGTVGPRVEALRRRLVETGDFIPAAVGGPLEAFDPALEAAVRAFQARHGLDTDGVVGARTLGALNVPVEVRIEQIILNMERRRWIPAEPGERHVFVNLADFELKVVERRRTVFTSRVVVGAPYHRTPVFSRPMTYLELNPYWHVPRSIATGELLPEIQRDPNYLTRNHFTVLTADGARTVDPAIVDWAALGPGEFSYRLRQEPGDGNALGRVKFMLPNPYNIYLHDTPAKALFGRTVRAFSHGCVRVEHPLEMAAVILGAQGWSRAEIDAAIARGERRVVTLKRPLPVHVTYLTAWVDEAGMPQFRDDVYGRDARLAAVLTS